MTSNAVYFLSGTHVVYALEYLLTAFGIRARFRKRAPAIARWRRPPTGDLFARHGIRRNGPARSGTALRDRDRGRGDDLPCAEPRALRRTIGRAPTYWHDAACESGA